MACDRTSVTLGGYTITFVSRTVNGTNTTFCYDVAGDGTAPHALSNFVVEICPNNQKQFINFINIVSCTKQTLPDGIIESASCSKVTKPNSSGNQVNLIGIKFDEGVGKTETKRFCFTVDAVLCEGCVNVGYKAATDVFQTTESETINGPLCCETPPPTPGEKNVPFCCYVTVPEGFEPAFNGNKPIVFSEIVSDCTFLCEGTETAIGEIHFNDEVLECEFELPRTDLHGCVKLQNALQINRIEGTGTTFVCCCDCVCIDETLCISCPECPSTPTDLAIAVNPCSIMATFVDSCAGKSVYKITGTIKITFTCPTCDLDPCDLDS